MTRHGRQGDPAAGRTARLLDGADARAGRRSGSPQNGSHCVCCGRGRVAGRRMDRNSSKLAEGDGRVYVDVAAFPVHASGDGGSARVLMSPVSKAARLQGQRQARPARLRSRDRTGWNPSGWTVVPNLHPGKIREHATSDVVAAGAGEPSMRFVDAARFARTAFKVARRAPGMLGAATRERRRSRGENHRFKRAPDVGGRCRELSGTSSHQTLRPLT